MVLEISKYENINNNKPVWVDAWQHYKRLFRPQFEPQHFFLETSAQLDVRNCPKLQS